MIRNKNKEQEKTERLNVCRIHEYLFFDIGTEVPPRNSGSNKHFEYFLKDGKTHDIMV